MLRLKSFFKKKLEPSEKIGQMMEDEEFFKIESVSFENSCLYLRLYEKLSPQERKTVFNKLDFYQKAHEKNLKENNARFPDELPCLVSSDDPNYLNITISGNAKLLVHCLKDNIMCSDSILDQIASRIPPTNPVASQR